MEKYYNAFINIFSVLCYYVIVAVLLNFNSNFQKIKLERQLYIIKNVVKAGVLLYLAIFSSIDFIRFMINDHFEMKLVYNYASLYVSNDFIALLIVPNLPLTTKIHHQITCLFLVYSLNVDFNELTNFAQLLFIYTIFSSYAFLVNFYLGMRFLKHDNNTYLNEIIEYSRISARFIYKYTCFINWVIQISIICHRLYIGVFNFHYTVYCFLLYFIIKDDLILMDWLKQK